MNREFNRGSLVNKYMSESVNHKQGLDYNCSPGHSLISSHLPVDQPLTVSNTLQHMCFSKNMHQQIQTCTLTRPDSESPLMLKKTKTCSAAMFCRPWSQPSPKTYTQLHTHTHSRPCVSEKSVHKWNLLLHYMDYISFVKIIKRKKCRHKCRKCNKYCVKERKKEERSAGKCRNKWKKAKKEMQKVLCKERKNERKKERSPGKCRKKYR